jgi:microcystin-dependent protein
MFAGNFAPAGWMFCEGQLLAISDNDTLFNLIGTTYGGDGQSTFGLPDLRGRVPMHFGNGFTQSQNGGTETVALTTAQLPIHTHALQAVTGAPAQANPNGQQLCNTGANPLYHAAGGQGAIQPLASTSIGSAGGAQPHDNLQPYLCIDFIISLFGIFPSQT